MRNESRLNGGKYMNIRHNQKPEYILYANLYQFLNYRCFPDLIIFEE
jgi:hypothetical protein